MSTFFNPICLPRLNTVEHSSVDKVRTNAQRVYVVLLHLPQLQPQGLVEAPGPEFGGAVVAESGYAHEASCGGDGYDVAVVGGDHVGEEGLDGPEVRFGVDTEGQGSLGVLDVEDGLSSNDPSVVDQDGTVPEVCGDLFGRRVDKLWGRRGGASGGDVRFRFVLEFPLLSLLHLFLTILTSLSQTLTL